MPRMMDITQDDELENYEGEGDEETTEGEEGAEEGDDKPKRKPPASVTNEVKEVRNELARLSQLVSSSGSKQDERRVSNLEKTLAELVKGGYKPEQLAALVEVAKAIKDDIDVDQTQKSAQQQTREFNNNCWSAVYGALDKLAETNGVDEKAFSYARDELAKRVAKTLESHEKFPDARNAYRQQILPDKKDFAAAARIVFETYKKESGMKSSDNRPAPQLDLKSSRSQASRSSSKNTEINLSELSDFEKEVYLSTKNITKNEELARKALDRVRGR